MKLLRTLKSFLPPVKLRVAKHLTTDIRDPRQVALYEHRQRRLREYRKVTATYLPVIPQSASTGGRRSHSDPVAQRPSGRAELQPTALYRALTDPAFLLHQAD